MAQAKKLAQPKLNEKSFQILLRPLVTEKTTKAAEQGNWIAFEVPLDATKTAIRAAVQGLYGVEVAAVNTLIAKGKNKVSAGRRTRRADMKKALVKLKAGQSIDLMAGVK